MAQIVFTAAADADSAAIFDYLTPKQGNGPFSNNDAFKTFYERVANCPDSGAPRPKVVWRIRIVIDYPYIVIYSHREADDILRVAHRLRQPQDYR